MDRLTRWNGTKWVLPGGRTSAGESYWRLIAEKLAAYENISPDPGKLVLKEEDSGGEFFCPGDSQSAME